jgi:GNAT superfamily N-acetyltransferase
VPTIRKLTESDDRTAFSCGDAELDRFFRQHAGQHQFKRRASVTYVATIEERLAGFATVCPGTMTRGDLGRAFRSFPPFPLPVLLVARLGVSVAEQGQGIGSALLKHGLELAWQMSSTLGCVGVLVDAKINAIEWYQRYGFTPVSSPPGSDYTRLFLPISSVPGDD